MLKRISQPAVRWFDLERAISYSAEEHSLSLDVDAFTSLVLPSDITWRGVAGVCGRTISPMYHGLQNMVQTDLDHVANLLSELEPLEEGEGGMQSSCVKEAADTSGVSKCPVAHGVRRDSHPPDIIQPRSCRKRRRSSTVNSPDPLIIRSAHPSIPTIVITPCPAQCRETSCWVPYQDGMFGARLTVPTHPVFNGTFPPLAPPRAGGGALPHMEKWRYVEGHWRAVVPTLEEQSGRGLFSKSTAGARRRSCRMYCRARSPQF